MVNSDEKESEGEQVMTDAILFTAILIRVSVAHNSRPAVDFNVLQADGSVKTIRNTSDHSPFKLAMPGRNIEADVCFIERQTISIDFYEDGKYAAHRELKVGDAVKESDLKNISAEPVHRSNINYIKHPTRKSLL